MEFKKYLNSTNLRCQLIIVFFYLNEHVRIVDLHFIREYMIYIFDYRVTHKDATLTTTLELFSIIISTQYLHCNRFLAVSTHAILFIMSIRGFRSWVTLYV